MKKKRRENKTKKNNNEDEKENEEKKTKRTIRSFACRLLCIVRMCACVVLRICVSCWERQHTSPTKTASSDGGAPLRPGGCLRQWRVASLEGAFGNGESVFHVVVLGQLLA